MSKQVEAKATVSFKKVIDGRTLNFVLDTNRPTTQIYSKDSVDSQFYPDYSKTPLIVTPVLTVAGSEGENMISGTCTWTVDGAEVTTYVDTVNGDPGDATVYASNVSADHYALYIKENLSDDDFKIIKCHYVYSTSIVGTIDIYATLYLIRIENAGKALMALIFANPGQYFRLTGDTVADIVLTGQMIRGASNDTSDVTFHWYIPKQDESGDDDWCEIGKTNVISTDATGGVVTAGAPDGSTIEDEVPSTSAALFTLRSDLNTDTKRTNYQLSVNSDACLNFLRIKMVAHDDDTSSSTAGNDAEAYITLYDLTDPIDLDMEQPDGDSIAANDSTGKRMRFVCFQSGKELDESFYDGKTIAFARNTKAGDHDDSFAECSDEDELGIDDSDKRTSRFKGWTADTVSMTFKRTFTSSDAPHDNTRREVRLLYRDLLSDEAETVFEAEMQS